MQSRITSIQNPLVKKIIQLQDKSRNRKKLGLFVIEGIREIELANKGGYQLEQLFYCPQIITQEEIENKSIDISRTNTIEISKEVYQKIAYRTSTEGIIALAKTKDVSLNAFIKNNSIQKNRLFLIAEAPEKPGNIGALLRTADAANIDALVIANPKTDIYNPNIIRSSVGCVFTTPIITSTTSEIIAYLKETNTQIFCAALQASIPYTTCNFTGNTAIVVGTEATGLTDEWLSNSTQNIIIPMEGEIDSMNVSVAAGILLFEAKRQRNL